MLGAIRNLCIERDWFDAGTNEQYGKMFDLCVDSTISNKEIAICIWLCSTKAKIEEITIELEKIRKDYTKKA